MKQKSHPAPSCTGSSGRKKKQNNFKRLRSHETMGKEARDLIYNKWMTAKYPEGN